MSADNYIGVFCSYDSLNRPSAWYAAHGMMSDIENEEKTKQWKKYIENNLHSHNTREAALIAAHSMAQKEAMLEYDVIEI